ncbi:MAG TPA: tripartite tricarboxylate transporter TctB family protein [Candidatus Binatia bacterium]|nr:tripartite tricarboxylate transporter TctB family protein [Candidatus Binatia bacterium]
MKKGAAISSILFLGLALGAFFESTKLPFGGMSTPGAGFFPAILAVGLAIAALFAGLDALREKSRDVSQGRRLTWGKIVMTVGSLLAFAFLLEILGYLVTTFLFVVFLLRAVERKGWVVAVAVGFSASFASYIVFGLLLGTPLPTGFLQI